MTDLTTQLERLGLDQYLDAFEREGFDTWETLLDIQESDLEALGVKLGHRRKLQRAIADYRGVPYDRSLGSPSHEASVERTQWGHESPAVTLAVPVGPPPETKRRYRRHPRPDENAPEKPPSAYVLFSNRVREDVKDEHLSFTEIAKLVGERWQKLDHAHKEPFESRATAMKDQYNVQLSAYKKTDAYREYTQYLAEFKAKNNPDHKRPRLDAQSSGGSASAASADPAEAAQPPAPPYGGTPGPSQAVSAGLTPSPASPATSSVGPARTLLDRNERPPLLSSVPSVASHDVSFAPAVGHPEARTASDPYGRASHPPVGYSSAAHVSSGAEYPGEQRSRQPPRTGTSNVPLAMTLPAILGSDRLPRITRDQRQRTLPPPHPPTAPLGHAGTIYSSGGFVPQSSALRTGDSDTRLPQAYHVAHSMSGPSHPRDDAATDALGGLATRPKGNDGQPVSDRRR